LSSTERAAANLLGALALAINDQAAESVFKVTGQSESAAAALSALCQFLDRPTLDELCQVLGLTPSGAVRLVDRLSAAGLVVREAGADGRSRSIALTARGRRVGLAVASEREAYLDRVIADLSSDEQSNLHSLLGRVMSNVVYGKEDGAWVCRLCDLEACGRPAGQCPAANAASVKYGNRRQPKLPLAD
jgi:DNA-binding MarR family transcriptional regulator